MKTIRLYECETCGTQYGRAELAKECEKSHQQPISMRPVRFNAKKNNGTYPAAIDIEFKDGKILRYKR